MLPGFDMPLMSYGEYAQHRGCSRPNISQAVKRGLIKPVFIGGKPKIDSDRADAEWAANAKPTMLAKQRPVAANDHPNSAAEVETPAYAVSRARREAAEAMLAEVELAKERGELVPILVARKEFSKQITLIRESVLQIPARMAPILAAEGDMGKVRHLLDVEIRSALIQAAGE
ncbi:MAG: hypothetical protein KBG32_06760 [Sulfuritalea sp.]|jgi:hypothetical protein|nr:hypothetical protein [Sulfuritalea sp.]